MIPTDHPMVTHGHHLLLPFIEEVPPVPIQREVRVTLGVLVLLSLQRRPTDFPGDVAMALSP
jgi:hypothetical protein